MVSEKWQDCTLEDYQIKKIECEVCKQDLGLEDFKEETVSKLRSEYLGTISGTHYILTEDLKRVCKICA